MPSSACRSVASLARARRPTVPAASRVLLLSAAVLAAGACAGGGPPADEEESGAGATGEAADPVVRVALFNVWQLSTAKVDSVGPDGLGAHPQLRAAARVLRSVRPDVLVLNEVDLARTATGELDRDDLGRVVRNFVTRYLAEGPEPLEYPHLFIAPSNTGDLSGLDLNRDGVTASEEDVGTRTYGDDSWGYGEYPGQYAMAVLSRFPLDAEAARTFRLFPWSDLPGNHLPRAFYGDRVADTLRLSSKSHWDVPVEVGDTTLHLWVSHPTPPGFDGEENRNGRRNFDEVGFWARYLDGSDALVDDEGTPGGYAAGHPFVIAGDLNADPSGGDAAVDGVPSISQLLDHPGIQDPEPLRGRPTAGFGGGARVDYVLPSAGLEVVDAGVVAPDPETSGELAEAAEEASDHYLVWVELRVPGAS